VYGNWSIVYVVEVFTREVDTTVGQNIIVIGGGGAGLGAAGGAKAVDPSASVTVFTENEDVAYSPCGIPFVHGKEIPSFEALFLADKQSYVDAGIEVRYQTKITAIDTSTKTVQIESDQPMRYDSLVISTGFSYANPGVPGGELDGLYYVKNIREAMEWDKRLDTVKKAVVVEASPLGVEMITALAHRGIETHVIDPNPWALGELADPDIVELAQESWAELGVTMHWNTSLQEFLGNESGAVRGVRTSNGDIECDLVVVATHKVPNSELAVAAGLKTGSTGGLIVDGGMQTSAAGVWASGDICEIPHGLGGLPLQGLTGSHAYAQGKVAGANAAGGNRTYNPVYVPWGMVAGKWMIGGVALGEVTANALGMPHVVAVADGISRARYYPGVKKVRVKLIAEPGTLRLIGAQMVGGEGIKERADFLGVAVKAGLTLHDLATMENVYSPPIGALNEPIAVAAQKGVASQMER
jgi:NADH oxidase (H2O2-forming)